MSDKNNSPENSAQYYNQCMQRYLKLQDRMEKIGGKLYGSEQLSEKERTSLEAELKRLNNQGIALAAEIPDFADRLIKAAKRPQFKN